VDPQDLKQITHQYLEKDADPATFKE